ncbi:MAG: hypothetical protein GKS06_13660 [Acidobacteria bacterium]|nr:hypothetical protein [Acidobacteriota bacterium]
MKPMIEDQTPQDVAEALEQNVDAVYLDVRTVEEFERGHVPGALNIPVAEPSPATGMMAPNPEFVRVATSSIAPDATIYCGCATGPRSRHAVSLLQQAGYAKAFNVAPGFNGVTDPLGRVIEAGWQALGLPVETGTGGALGYEELAASAASSEAAPDVEA